MSTPPGPPRASADPDADRKAALEALEQHRQELHRKLRTAGFVALPLLGLARVASGSPPVAIAIGVVVVGLFVVSGGWIRDFRRAREELRIEETDAAEDNASNTTTLMLVLGGMMVFVFGLLMLLMRLAPPAH